MGSKQATMKVPIVLRSARKPKRFLTPLDRRTALGKRGYALLVLLLHTGIRRAEAVGLTIGDLGIEKGYHVAIIRHGNGNKRGLAKLPVEVWPAKENDAS